MLFIKGKDFNTQLRIIFLIEMKFNFKGLIVLALILVFVISFGCTSTLSDKGALDEFSTLKQKYFANDSLPTNNALLNDYISDLSALRGKSSGSAGKVIEAELYFAQTFYYLNDSLSNAAGIDIENMLCSSTGVKNTITSANLANDYCQKAITAIGTLSDNEKTYLSAGAVNAIDGYKSRISQIKAFFEKKC
ncbi:MAG: hypothetical protein WCI04_05965 [archaeon]